MPRIYGFTGDRKIAADKIEEVRCRLHYEIFLALLDGADRFVCGMCDGADLEFAEIIIRAKAIKPDISLEAALPFRDRMNTENSRFHDILEKCDKITFTGEEYNRNCYRVRNAYIVQQSDCIIAVFDGRKRTGTAQTLNIARKENREIRLINI